MSIESIAIIGAGIGGLSSAIFLSRKGYKVTVFDKAIEPKPVGAGFLLQPPGQDVLAELGILDEVARLSVPIHGLKSQTASGYKLLDLHYNDLKGEPRNGLGVQRSTIYQALLQLASSCESVQFKWGCDVEECRAENGKSIIHVKSDIHSYDLCILASGSNSHLADVLFPDRVKKPYSWKCLWTTIKLPSGFSESILHQRCHQASKMMGLLPVSKTKEGYEAVLYWSLKSEDAKNFSEQSFLSVKREIIDFWPEARESIESLEYSDFIVANYNDLWTPNPFNKNFVAIGDISHSTSPQLGQGCTMALLDSQLLAQHLSNHRELNESLEVWWRSRKKQLMYVRHVSRLLTPLYQSDQSLYGVFRNFIIAPMGRIHWLYQLQLKTLASVIFLKKK